MDDGKPENTSTKDWLLFMATARPDVLDMNVPHHVTAEEIHQARGGEERNRYAPDPSTLGKGSRLNGAIGGDTSFESCFRELRKPPSNGQGPSPKREIGGGVGGGNSPLETPPSPTAPPSWKPYPNEGLAEERNVGEMPPDPWDGPNDANAGKIEGPPGGTVGGGGAFLREMMSISDPNESRLSEGNPYRPPELNRPAAGDEGSLGGNPASVPGDRDSRGGLFEAEMARQEGAVPSPSRATWIGQESPRRPFPGNLDPSFDPTDGPGMENRGSPRRGDEEFRAFESPSRRHASSPRGDGYDRHGYELPPGVRRFEEDLSERYKKKGLLAELDALKMRAAPLGIKPTEDYTIDSPLADIQWEVTRIEDLLHRTNKTRQWRHRISRTVRLAERLDEEYGPKVHISGITEDVQEELGGWEAVLDDPLDRIFRKSRRGESNPYMDIAGALAAPVILRFVTNAFLKGRKSDLLYQTVLGDRKKNVSGPEPPPPVAQPPPPPQPSPRPRYQPKQESRSPMRNAWDRREEEPAQPNGYPSPRNRPGTPSRQYPQSPTVRNDYRPRDSPRSAPNDSNRLSAENEWHGANHGAYIPNEAPASAWAAANERTTPPQVGHVRRRPRVPLA